MKRSLILILGSLLLTASAYAMPAQVLIIRHGEKPESGNHLSPEGVARAQGLVHFFKTDPTVNRFGKIAGIYAMKPSDEDGSYRAIETVTPSATALGLTVNSEFKKKKVHKLMKDIRDNPAFDGKTVLICWEHKWIPEITYEFGLLDGPEHWGGDEIFDRMWVLNFASDEQVTFENRGEHVLPGDSI